MEILGQHAVARLPAGVADPRDGTVRGAHLLAGEDPGWI
jgi:hypothetical protein